MSFLKEAEYLQNVAVGNIPEEEEKLKPGSSWIAIVLHTSKGVPHVKQTQDFFWARAHGKITIRTIKHGYSGRCPLDEFAFSQEDMFPKNSDTVQQLRERSSYKDEVIVLRIWQGNQIRDAKFRVEQERKSQRIKEAQESERSSVEHGEQQNELTNDGTGLFAENSSTPSRYQSELAQEAQGAEDTTRRRQRTPRNGKSRAESQSFASSTHSNSDLSLPANAEPSNQFIDDVDINSGPFYANPQPNNQPLIDMEPNREFHWTGYEQIDPETLAELEREMINFQDEHAPLESSPETARVQGENQSHQLEPSTEPSQGTEELANAHPGHVHVGDRQVMGPFYKCAACSKDMVLKPWTRPSYAAAPYLCTQCSEDFYVRNGRLKDMEALNNMAQVEFMQKKKLASMGYKQDPDRDAAINDPFDFLSDDHLRPTTTPDAYAGEPVYQNTQPRATSQNTLPVEQSRDEYSDTGVHSKSLYGENLTAGPRANRGFVPQYPDPNFLNSTTCGPPLPNTHAAPTLDPGVPQFPQAYPQAYAQPGPRTASANGGFHAPQAIFPTGQPHQLHYGGQSSSVGSSSDYITPMDSYVFPGGPTPRFAPQGYINTSYVDQRNIEQTPTKPVPKKTNKKRRRNDHDNDDDFVDDSYFHNNTAFGHINTRKPSAKKRKGDPTYNEVNDPESDGGMPLAKKRRRESAPATPKRKPVRKTDMQTTMEPQRQSSSTLADEELMEKLLGPIQERFGDENDPDFEPSS